MGDQARRRLAPVSSDDFKRTFRRASFAALCTILPASGCASAQTPPARHDVSRVRMTAMRDTIDSLDASKQRLSDLLEDITLETPKEVSS